MAFVLAVYAASRLFYLICGSLLAYLVPTSSFQRVTLDASREHEHLVALGR